MKLLSRGDIVLVPFPFTDLSGRKVRPAVIVNIFGEDILVAFISSVISPGALPATDFVLPANHSHFAKTGLKSAATFKLSKLICLHQSCILRKLGSVSEDIQRELDSRLVRAVGLKL